MATVFWAITVFFFRISLIVVTLQMLSVIVINREVAAGHPVAKGLGDSAND